MANFQNIIEFLRLNRRFDEANKNTPVSTEILLTYLEDSTEDYIVDRAIFENNNKYKLLFGILDFYNAKIIYVWETNADRKYLVKNTYSEYVNLLDESIESPTVNELVPYNIEEDATTSYFYDVDQNRVVTTAKNIVETVIFPDYIYYDPNSSLLKDVTSGDYDYSFKNPTTIFAEALKMLLNFTKYGIDQGRKKTVTITKSPKVGKIKLFPFLEFNISLNKFILKYPYFINYNNENTKSIFSPSDDDCALVLRFRSVGGFLSFLNDTLFSQGVQLSSSGSPIRKDFQESFKNLIITPLEKNLKSNVQLYYNDALDVLYYLPDSISIELSNETLWLLVEEGVRRNGLNNDLQRAEEDIYLKLLEILLEREGEENNFIERLSKQIDKNGTLLLEYLYDRINGENGVKFAHLVNKAWRKSRFVDSDIEVNKEFKSTNGPLILPYESQKWLGLYFSNAKATFENNKEKERILQIAYDTGTTKTEMRPSIKTDNLVATSIPVIDYFWYHPFYPVSLKNIEKQETEIKLDSIVPAFMLKANTDKQFWSNVITSAEYAVDIATTLSGIGNLTKFKYLSQLAARGQNLSFVSRLGQAVATTRKIVTGTAAIIEITSATVNALLKLTDLRDTKFGKSLSELLFWLELLSLSGELTVAIHNGLRKSAKDLVDIDKELDELFISDGDEQRKLTQIEKENFINEIKHTAGISENIAVVVNDAKKAEKFTQELQSLINLELTNDNAIDYIELAIKHFNFKVEGNSIIQISRTNCVNIVQVVEDFFKTGKIILAEHSEVQEIFKLAEIYKNKFLRYDSLGSLKNVMKENERGILFIYEEGSNKSGHVVNVFKRNGKFEFFDGQSGRRAAFGYNKKYQYLKTTN